MKLIQLDAVALLMNPFILMFLTIVFGLLIGKIFFGKFNLGTSGVLFAGLGIGWAVYKYALHVYETDDPTAAGMKAAVQIMEGNSGKLINQYFFSAALIIFVACVGLLAAKDLGVVLRKYGVKFVILGILITFTGAGASYISSALVQETNPFAVCGVYTGAMTSSPGLASALETVESRAADMAERYSELEPEEKATVLDLVSKGGKDENLTIENTKKLTEEQKETFVNQAAGQVGIGSAVAYPFGVIIVILAVNFLNVIFRFDVEEEKARYRLEMEAARGTAEASAAAKGMSILAFVIVCLTGYLLGSVRVYAGPLGYISLESTGGVLIASLLLGYVGKIGPVSFRMDPRLLTVLRELGLAFFLSVVGLNYGYGVVDAIRSSGLILAGISLFVGFVSIMSGFFVGRYLFGLNWVLLSGAICGGMTSTPGLGAATDAVNSDDPAVGYGATYPFALFGMVIFTIIILKLPIL
ncbi:hypothetical protein AALA24_13325 [Anaerovoracaceae bacterium 42-11]